MATRCQNQTQSLLISCSLLCISVCVYEKIVKYEDEKLFLVVDDEK